MRLAEEKNKVSEVVHARVRRDYEAQQTALEEEAAPLVVQARAEYSKLAELLGEIEDASQTTKLEEEELELRHRLGEFDEEEFKNRAAKIQTRLKAQKRDLGEATKVRKKFLAAFDSEDELTAGAPPVKEVSPVTKEVIPPPVPKEEAAIPKTMATPMPEIPHPEPVAAKNKGKGKEEKKKKKEKAAEPAVVSSAADAGPARTQLLAIARLVQLDGETKGVEHPVQPITTFGRGADNQIQIDESAVSRHHAQITLEVEGFVIRDLDSQNGTYVNGDPVKERRLVNGDRLQIGTARYVFRPS